jgi:hypothetical protein
MADDADLAQDVIEADLERRIAAARGYTLPAGEQGECELCGEWSGRLLGGACAPCRDKYKLP